MDLNLFRIHRRRALRARVAAAGVGYGRLVQMGITVLPSIRDGLHCISRRRTRHRVAVIQKLTDAKLSRGDSAISAICDRPSH